MGGVKKYVLGFAFDEYNDHVVLIKKNRPEWQAGKYNGVGGKVEVGELHSEAMVREFHEETGILTEYKDWTYVGVLRDEFEEQFTIGIFAIKIDSHWVTSMTDEEVVVVDPSTVNRYNAIPNLEFLIPMAKLVLETDHPSLEIKEVA